jgi:hypothetical protein
MAERAADSIQAIIAGVAQTSMLLLPMCLAVKASVTVMLFVPKSPGEIVFITLLHIFGTSDLLCYYLISRLFISKIAKIKVIAEKSIR